MNILLLASHAVAEYDDLRMFTDMGHDVFCPGGYEVPGQAPEGIRPPLPDSPAHPDLVARLQETRSLVGDPGPLIDAGKARLHPDIIDWADAIIVHHFPEQWIGGQWDRIRHKRVIWRTCGQSDPRLEMAMKPYRDEGLQIVRYSPAERRYFESVGCFAGQDALIRFGKYPQDYGPWTGDWTMGGLGTEATIIRKGLGAPTPYVANVTQDMAARGDACGYGFWQAATEGLPTMPAGKGSETIGGLGALPYEAMLKYLAGSRVYLYLGTTPASYTLGLIEAMLSGVPVVSVGSHAWKGPAELFEGDYLTYWSSNEPDQVNQYLWEFLRDEERARAVGVATREIALHQFDIATVSEQWQAFLS